VQKHAQLPDDPVVTPSCWCRHVVLLLTHGAAAGGAGECSPDSVLFVSSASGRVGASSSHPPFRAPRTVAAASRPQQLAGAAPRAGYRWSAMAPMGRPPPPRPRRLLALLAPAPAAWPPPGAGAGSSQQSAAAAGAGIDKKTTHHGFSLHFVVFCPDSDTLIRRGPRAVN
jgi:hypothetical protein